MDLWGELRGEPVLGNVYRTGEFVRDDGRGLRSTEYALLYVDLAVVEVPRSPDSGDYGRRPVRHFVLRRPRFNLKRANERYCRAQPASSSHTRPDVESLTDLWPGWESEFSS